MKPCADPVRGSSAEHAPEVCRESKGAGLHFLQPRGGHLEGKRSVERARRALRQEAEAEQGLSEAAAAGARSGGSWAVTFLFLSPFSLTTPAPQSAISLLWNASCKFARWSKAWCSR